MLSPMQQYRDCVMGLGVSACSNLLKKSCVTKSTNGVPHQATMFYVKPDIIIKTLQFQTVKIDTVSMEQGTRG